MTHKSADLFGNIEFREFGANKVAQKYEKDFTTRDIILRDIQEFVRLNSDFHAAIQPLSDGIYIFGHTHTQWHARHKNKIFINPGSCGVPVDGAEGAPYTLLSIENNQAHITERRVKYDVNKLIHNMRNSDAYKAVPVWGEIVLQTLDARFERTLSFLQFVENYANKINDHVRPFSVETWTVAFKLWQENKQERAKH